MTATLANLVLRPQTLVALLLSFVLVASAGCGKSQPVADKPKTDKPVAAADKGSGDDPVVPASGLHSDHGYLETVSDAEISGWAWDPKTPGVPIEIEILDGDKLLASILADQTRQELIQFIGSAQHGFSITTPAALRDGKAHVIRVRVKANQADLTGSPHKPATFSQAKAPPATDHGYLETVSDTEISGWAWDPKTPGVPIEVEIYDGGTRIALVLADQNHPELAKVLGHGKHGFKIPTPAAIADGKLHSIRVRVKSNKVELNGSPMTMTLTPRVPTDQGYLEVANDEEISGWAWDPKNPGAAIEVEIYDNKTLLTTVLADQNHPELAKTLGNGKYGFKFKTPAALKDGKPHLIRVLVKSNKMELNYSPLSVTLPKK